MNVLQTHTHLSIPTIHCILKELEQPIPQFVHYKKPNNNIHNPEFEFHLWQTTHQIFLCHWFLSNLSDHLCLHVFPCFWVPSLPCFLCSCLFFSTFLFSFLFFPVFHYLRCLCDSICFCPLSLNFLVCSSVTLTFLFALSDSRIMANEGVDNQSSWTGGKTSPESNIATKWKKMTWKLLCTITIVEKN